MSFVPLKIEIKSLMLVESGTYNPQYRRSYTTDDNEAAAVDILRDRLAGRRVTGPGSLAGVAGQIVRMSGKHSGELSIDANGWDCRRFLFMMSVDVYAQGSVMPNRQIIMGFSENTEMSMQRTIDPQMRFTINTIVSLRPVTTIDRGRRIVSMVPVDCSHVLSNNSFRGLRQDSEMRIDPYDMMGLMMVNQGLYQEDNAPLYNYTGLHTHAPVKVQRKYSQPASYLSGILKSFGDAASNNRSPDTNMPNDVDHATLCTSAQSYIPGSNASSDGFLLAIRSVSSENYLSNHFTLTDLKRLHPNHPTDLFMQGQTRKDTSHTDSSRYNKSALGDNAHSTGDTADWGGINAETEFASMVSHGVPGLMMELFFTDIHFRATNETHDKSILVEVLHKPGTLEEFDCRSFIEKFEDRLVMDILNDACMNGQIPFDFECRCDIVTETWIDISIDGGRPMTFNTPTFCDSLMTPMVSSADNASLIASDLNCIVNDVVLGDNASNASKYSGIVGYESSMDYGRDTTLTRRDNRGGNSPFRIIT